MERRSKPPYMQDLRKNLNGEEKEIAKINVEIALKAVATTVFPHQALQMKKPVNDEPLEV